MPNKRIVTGQHIPTQQFDHAKEMRCRMTPAERKLWQRLRTGRLEGFHFLRQQVIDSYIVDFYCHATSLVVEVDGGVHLKQEEYDRERDVYLYRRGLKVLHFTNLEVNHNLESVLSVILEACQHVEPGGKSDG